MGNVPFDDFGRSVSGAGDVNGGGVADFILGTFPPASMGRNPEAQWAFLVLMDPSCIPLMEIRS
ncbi:MAG: hypothetical protein ACI97A_001040 [Planctomycetota bacterium]|jgi:hypothetical protein